MWVNMFGGYFCALYTSYYVPEYIIIDMSVKAGTPTNEMCGIPMHICSIMSIIIYNIILCLTICVVWETARPTVIFIAFFTRTRITQKKKKKRNT